jgi:4-amino-4-deoxy-L-arabinose transferase-like glycosyltransferase
LALLALALGWRDPVSAGDLRPSPDAVEYALGAAALARFQPPVIRIGDRAVPPRYPFGVPALAAPFFWLPSRGGHPELYRAVFASLASAVVAVVAVWWTGRLAFGTAAGVLAAALTVLSPFFQTYSRVVMAEMPSAAVFAMMAAVLATGARAGAEGGALVEPGATGKGMSRVADGDGGLASQGDTAVSGRTRCGRQKAWTAGPRFGVLLGLLLALAVTIRLANVQAAPAIVLALLAMRGRRVSRLVGFAVGAAVGALPLVVYQWATYGSPLTTGYALWTPEWAGGGRPVFDLSYALQAPALPSRAAQPNLAHYLAAWLGWQALGDAGEPVGSPVHATLAGVLAVAALVGTWRGLRSSLARPATIFTVGGTLSAFALYALYFYQDVRYVAPWVPLWLLLSAAGIALPLDGLKRGALRQPVLAVSAVVSGALVAMIALELAVALVQAPLWPRVAGRRPGAVPPRLAQVHALAAETPDDAWIISAVDGPYLSYYVLEGSDRRYLPLARGLEFVDKPPFASVPTAQQLHGPMMDRLAPGGGSGGPRGTVLIDRWSLEFAEGLPDFRREMDRALEGFDLLPGGDGAPRRPSFYRLAAPRPDHGLASYALVDGETLAGSGPEVYVYEQGRRRHVASVAAFSARGLRWEDVRRLPDRVLDLLPLGPEIT